MARILELSACTVDLDRAVVQRGSTAHPLTEREVALLAWLADRPGQDVSREVLLTEVWGYAPRVSSRTVDTTVRRLRQKIEARPVDPEHLLTVYGVGYRLALGRGPPVDTDLLGRDGDLEAIDRLVAPGGVLSLTGPAGVGKTSLARAWFDGRRQGYDGAWFCALPGARTRDAVIAAVAAAIDLPADATDRIGPALASRGRTLLVLDNLEQVAGEAARLVGSWLAEAANLHILTTSRETLRIRAERVLPLAPLGTEDAVALFLRRARARFPDFAPDGPDLADIADIVDRLDRLPLAVELAAARVGLFTPAELRARLDDRLELLTDRRRDAPHHQGSLAGALDWSWDLLDAPERTALARLSVFRGGFTGPLARPVLGEGADDVLQALVDKSLVHPVRADALRFEILETVRLYAAAKLRERSDQAETRRRHREAVLAWARPRSAFGPSSRQRRKPLEAERHNLEAVADTAADEAPADALEALLALQLIVFDTGPLDSHRGRLERVVARVDDPVLAAQGRIALSDTCRLTGAADVAIAHLDAIFAAGCPPSLRTRALALRGLLRHQTGTTQPVDADLAEAATTAATSFEGAYADAILGAVLVDRGAFASARAPLERAAERFRQAHDPERLAVCLRNLGNAHVALGELGRAHEVLSEGRTCARTDGAPMAQAFVAESLGHLHLCVPRLDEATDAYAEAEKLYLGLGMIDAAASARANRGWALLESGALDDAALALDAAVADLAGGARPRAESAARLQRAVLRLARGAPEAALEDLDRAVHVSGGAGRIAAFVEAHRAAVLAELGRLDEAGALLAAPRGEWEDPAVSRLWDAAAGFVALARAGAEDDDAVRVARQRWRVAAADRHTPSVRALARLLGQRLR